MTSYGVNTLSHATLLGWGKHIYNLQIEIICDFNFFVLVMILYVVVVLYFKQFKKMEITLKENKIRNGKI